MALASFLIAAALSFVGASPASADAFGRLQTSQGWCLESHISAGIVANLCNSSWAQLWNLEIVAYVGQDPRYRVRNEGTNDCLVAFASSGRVGTYRCNSAWADQVWAFQYVKIDPSDGLPRFWLRNKHSGRCLALNVSRNPDAFMTTCGDYRDQLWKAPGT
jgi:hypothetical protein